MVHLVATKLASHCKTNLWPLKKLYTTSSSSLANLITHYNLKPTNHLIQCLADHPNPQISSFLQNGFSKITTKTVGLALHGFIIKLSNDLGVFETNTLMSMYSKFGNLKAVRYLFDEMPKRNEASWGTMISAYVKMGFYVNAIRLFNEMRFEGFGVSGFVVASVFTACNRSLDMVCEGFQVHGLVVKHGFCSVFVCTSLLHFYGVYGLGSEARGLFEEMPERNVVSWTSLMVGYSSSGDFVEVINAYKHMKGGGVDCNQNTFSSVISACGSLEDRLLGYQVLGDVVKCGLDDDVSVANALVSMFGNFGEAHEAWSVFDRMYERDTVSWNSMISAFACNMMHEEALECFYLMCHDHNDFDATTLSTLSSVCGTVNSLKCGKGVHGLAVKSGLDSNLCVCNTLLTMYSEAGRCEDMEGLFEAMPERNLISWNSVMAGYVQEGRRRDTLKVLGKLLQIRKKVNHVTFASALAACSDPDFLVEGKAVHALVFVAGLHDNLIVGNALVSMYGKCGMTWEAEQIFQIMPGRDLVTWNALIGSYAENEEASHVMKLFMSMRKEGMHANYITMINVLAACFTPRDLPNHGMPLHGHAILTGFICDDFVKNSLITMYAKCGDLKSSNNIFYGWGNRTSVTWNAMVAAYAHHGYGEEALKLFVTMQRAKVDLDEFSFSAVLAAAASLAILEEGQQLHVCAIKHGFDISLYVRNATMDMYGKCGEMNDVLKLLPEPYNRSRLSWNILISVFSRHGSFQEARKSFHEMTCLGVKPDHVTFVSLLSACSHGGLVDEGLAYFASMTRDFGVPVAIEHCVCIIDLLGRTGRLSEAEGFIQKMPVPPNDFVWRSLLAASRIHGNVDLGRKAAEHLLETDPSDDSAYVLYSNVCATSGRWEDVQNVRGEMELKNVKKQPACSWVKLRNKVSSFSIGDRSHPQTEQIYTKLGELEKKIKEAGYIPATSFSLHDTDEEQKEHSLWNHSERLALAYGLISTTKGSTLRIFKNLRVCGDCHAVYKFVSSIVNRQIILRDPYRFHQFDGGKCSCGDYW
ncbi:pentatricopeptide repeat-containing protein At2g03880, mitochondrial [Apium graveolens]|uniref:pentatricopeptide repeat-containing protein At2g03880, mitochondrial n=1 Tax=Apium graveolens TaxID=4045 RepID=UPI003D7B76C6